MYRPRTIGSTPVYTAFRAFHAVAQRCASCKTTDSSGKGEDSGKGRAPDVLRRARFRPRGRVGAFARNDRPSQVFWSNGYVWGTCAQKPTGDGVEVELTVLYGSLRIERMTLEGRGTVEFDQLKTIAEGTTERLLVNSQTVGQRKELN